MSQNSENKISFNTKINPDWDTHTHHHSMTNKGSVNNLGGPAAHILTIKDSSRLIFFVSKFFGFSLFTLPQVDLMNHAVCRKFKIKTTLTNIAILIFMIIVYTYLLYYNTMLHFKVTSSESLILTVGGQVCLIFGLIVSIGSMLLAYMRRKTVFKIFINLCYIDIVLEKSNETFIVEPLCKRRQNVDVIDKTPFILEHKNHLKFSAVFLLMGLIFICLDMAATFVIINAEFNANPLVYVSYALQNASFLIIITQTVLFLLVIKTRYAALNKLICYYLTIEDTHPEVEELYDLQTISENQVAPTNSTVLRNGFRFDKKIIAQFAQTHDKLTDIVEWINGCYTVQCLGVVAVSFGYVILTFFSLYYALYRPGEKTTQLTIVYMAWFIFYVFCVMSLIIASWAVTNEGGTTGVLLHKSINEIIVDTQLVDSQVNEMIRSLRTFSLQLQKRSPIVTCGLFNYDWTLLFAIIASSATYLIILIQFDSSGVPKTCGQNITSNGTF